MAGPKPSTSIEAIERAILGETTAPSEAQTQTQIDGTPIDPSAEGANTAVAPGVDLGSEPGAQTEPLETPIQINLTVGTISIILDAIDHYRIHLTAMAQRAATETTGSLLNPHVPSEADAERRAIWDSQLRLAERAREAIQASFTAATTQFL